MLPWFSLRLEHATCPASTWPISFTTAVRLLQDARSPRQPHTLAPSTSPSPGDCNDCRSHSPSTGCHSLLLCIYVGFWQQAQATVCGYWPVVCTAKFDFGGGGFQLSADVSVSCWPVVKGAECLHPMHVLALCGCECRVFWWMCSRQAVPCQLQFSCRLVLVMLSCNSGSVGPLCTAPTSCILHCAHGCPTAIQADTRHAVMQQICPTGAASSALPARSAACA